MVSPGRLSFPDIAVKSLVGRAPPGPAGRAYSAPPEPLDGAGYNPFPKTPHHGPFGDSCGTLNPSSPSTSNNFIFSVHIVVVDIF